MSESNLQFDISKLNFNPMKIKKNSKEKNKTIPQITNQIIDSNDQINTNKKIIDNIPTQIKLSGIHNNNLIEINKQLEQELINKKEEIQNLKKNYKAKVSLIESDNQKNILQIEEKYKDLIRTLNNTFETKTLEIKSQYNSNIEKINQQYLNLLNEVRNLRANSISLQSHYEKINEIKNYWEKKFKQLKDDYENKFKSISNKIEKNLPLDDLFQDIKNKIDISNLNQMINIIKLKNKINYSNYILELANNFNENCQKINKQNIDKINNLKLYTNQKFNQLLNNDYKKLNTLNSINTNNNDSKRINNLSNNNTNIINTGNNNNIFNSYYKKSELVNYGSISKNDISINKSKLDDNNLSISKSISNIQEKFSSDLESFNFNDDSIPNKDIQIINPPELIK